MNIRRGKSKLAKRREKEFEDFKNVWCIKYENKRALRGLYKKITVIGWFADDIVLVG